MNLRLLLSLLSTLLLTFGLVGLAGCPVDDDDDSGDDDDATGDDDDATGDDDDATGDDDDATGDDDDATGDDDDATGDDDDTTGDDDDSMGDDDDSGQGGGVFEINDSALMAMLTHTPGSTACPQDGGSLTVTNNGVPDANLTATFDLSTGGNQVFGFADANVESGGSGMATFTGTIPGNGGTLDVFAGFIYCQVASDNASNWTVNVEVPGGSKMDVAEWTGTMDITFN